MGTPTCPAMLFACPPPRYSGSLHCRPSNLRLWLAPPLPSTAAASVRFGATKLSHRSHFSSPSHSSALGLSPIDLLDESALDFFASSSLHLSQAAASTADAVAAMSDTAQHVVSSSITADPEQFVDLTPELEEMSLDVLGHDIFLFLAVSVLVEPVARFINVTPVLLYLLLGLIAGPNGLSLFQGGEEVNSQIGDFGILFLLFIEGLNLSPERLEKLGSFFSLGATQLIFSVGVIFFAFFLGGPMLLPIVQDIRVPIDDAVLSLLDTPVIAFSVAAAGALSSSAFVLPVLKEKGWEKRSDGLAALSILLLQDLAVAPLLVILPLIAEVEGGGSMDTNALSLLVAKATIGFGGVLVVASQVLRQMFQIVASYGSGQTFVAASLLVACGMGIVAEDLGLSSTTGAFAAGVLLAESGYRAQIEADIKPFEGILLGIFFTTAGASLDPQTVIEQWPTLLVGISTFIAIKFSVIFAAGEFALGLSRADSARIGLLLAGGGEFAFVIFKLASDLDTLPESLCKLLTASVIISMSLTPVLGEVAEWVGSKFDSLEASDRAKIDWSDDYNINLTDDNRIQEAFETFDEDGSGAISAEELQGVLTRPGTSNEMLSLDEIGAIIARFDDNGDGELQFEEFSKLWTSKRRRALNGGDENENPTEESTELTDVSHAVVICGYGEVGQLLSAALESEAQKTGGRVRYIAFSKSPSRISAGVLNGASVVYGDGANPGLVKAAGVEKPLAIVILYDSQPENLDAIRRLRNSFPSVPIYARASEQRQVTALKDAGATHVIVEKKKVAEGFANLLGVTIGTSISRRDLLDSVPSLMEEDGNYSRNSLPYSNEELTDLANEGSKTKEEMIDLYKLFVTSFNRNEEGKVQLAELRNEVMRKNELPITDDELAAWMGYDESLSKWSTGEAETIWVSYADFVRFTSRARFAADSSAEQ